MKNLLIFITILSSSTAFADNLNSQQLKDVQLVIALFKQKNISAISNHIVYPLAREEPLPSIQPPTEMKQRFNQVFDAKLIQNIANSKPSQWQSVGWRGVMLDSGTVWLEGHQIKAVNYSSDAEQKLKAQLISQQKQKLHPSLRNFSKPDLQFKTTKFQIRIDEMPNGQYRYAAWGVNQSQTEIPDLILNQGKVVMDGSGGDHHYIFNSGGYQYIIYRNLLGTSETPDVQLEVTLKAKTVLSQNGYLF
ncbi:hypothetical protein ABIC56_003317 [Acinetobacter bereziniae]|uniref:hypothetical protein n=1 Tax=Acinetobacter bereziniae TaxID=106648 RepID=UPI0028596126|nr:hypothetical protein [Acinetobacter bereziniae]MDR6543320.1 hypothetical protein [Acinetobacter bereziniae]